MFQRCVLYARVSSDDTRKDGRNLAGQLEMCREYAQKRGWVVVAELAEDDRGASGASMDLPQLARLLEMARAREYDVVVVREIDRFSRRLAKQLIVEEELKRHGVHIEYVLGEYPEGPEGNLMKHVKASVAEYEREKIAQRMTRGRRQVVKNGGIMLHGDKPPYGYRLSPDGKTIVICEDEARIIRLIFTWYADGDESGRKLGSRLIAQRLTEMGVPTWEDIHGYNSKKRGSGKWSTGVVGRVLSRETYLGRWHYGRRKNNRMNPESYWLVLDVPAIITEDLWKRAQAQKETNKAKAKRNSRRQYLMSGRVNCGVCETKMYGLGRPANGKLYLYYNCNMKRTDFAIKKPCDIGTFRADHVDQLVWEWVHSLIIDPQTLCKGLESYRTRWNETMTPLRERLGVAEKLLEDNRRQLQRLLDLYLSGDFPREMLVERRTQLERTVEALERERADLVARLDAQSFSEEHVEAIQRHARGIAEGLGQAEVNFELRRAIIEELDVRAVLRVEDGVKVISASCFFTSKVLRMQSGKAGANKQRLADSARDDLSIAEPTTRNGAQATGHPRNTGGNRRPIGRTSRHAPSCAG